MEIQEIDFSILSVQFIEVTKEMAQEWLDRVHPEMQRNLSEHYARRYLTDMNNGSWHDRVPTVDFDKRGRLINGQHVLTAFLRSNLKILWVTLRTAMRADAFAGFDHNRKRSARDDLQVLKVDRAGDMASAAAPLWQFLNGKFDGLGYLSARSTASLPTEAEVVKTVKNHPGLIEHLWKNPFRGKEIGLSGLRAASYLLHDIEPKLQEKFFYRLLEGVDNKTGDPIHVLRRSLETLAERERLRNGETMARTFKAWNYFVAGEDPPRGPLLRPREPFPRPLSAKEAASRPAMKASA